MQVEDRIRWKPLRLIGFIADKILAADEQCIAANLEGVGDRIIDSRLDSIARDCRDSIAGQDLDIAVDVRKRTVGPNLERVEEAGIDQGIAGI